MDACMLFHVLMSIERSINTFPVWFFSVHAWLPDVAGVNTLSLVAETKQNDAVMD